MPIIIHNSTTLVIFYGYIWQTIQNLFNAIIIIVVHLVPVFLLAWHRIKHSYYNFGQFNISSLSGTELLMCPFSRKTRTFPVVAFAVSNIYGGNFSPLLPQAACFPPPGAVVGTWNCHFKRFQNRDLKTTYLDTGSYLFCFPIL